MDEVSGFQPYRSDGASFTTYNNKIRCRYEYAFKNIANNNVVIDHNQ